MKKKKNGSKDIIPPEENRRPPNLKIRTKVRAGVVQLQHNEKLDTQS
jgi:hypothetical protein